MAVQEAVRSIDSRQPATREVQVSPQSGKKPKVVANLSDWQYLERSIHRLIAGWGRHFPDWEDKRDVCRHIWEQSECVRRLRERLVEFPGTSSNLDAPVSAKLEALVNTVLLAPSHADAVDGIYQILTGALVRSYINYVETAHPVHDAPTVAMVRDIVRIKEQQRLWLRNYRRRYPHSVNPAYREAIELSLASCGDLKTALPVEDAVAQPAGINTSFRPPLRAAKLPHAKPKLDMMSYIEADFTQSIEARRLFWCYGYMHEQNLADEQMVWLYDAHGTPWEFQQDVSRHLWDESRHGDSGYSRFLDFGFTPEEIGFADYDSPVAAQINDPKWADTSEPYPVLSAETLYERVYFIGMCAETGHFPVKHEAYADFKDGGDLESAEMMLFDIIDETSHVQYAHRWLPLLAERAGIDPDDFKERGRRERQSYQDKANARQMEMQKLVRDPADPAYVLYQEMIAVMRAKLPLTNAETCPPRSFKPM